MVPGREGGERRGGSWIGQEGVNTYKQLTRWGHLLLLGAIGGGSGWGKTIIRV